MDDIGADVAADLIGARVDSNKVLVSATQDGGAGVAIAFRAAKANGTYRYFWLYRVKFTVPTTSLTTKGDSVEFSTPEIEDTNLRLTTRENTGRYGGLNHLGDKLMKSENFEQAIEEVIRLICLLSNQDVAIWNFGHPDDQQRGLPCSRPHPPKLPHLPHRSQLLPGGGYTTRSDLKLFGRFWADLRI